MARRYRAILTAAVVAITAVLSVGWAHSHSTTDVIGYVHRPVALSILSSRGRLILSMSNLPTYVPLGPSPFSHNRSRPALPAEQYVPDTLRSTGEIAGFQYWSGQVDGTSVHALMIPWYCLCGAMAILAFIVVLRRSTSSNSTEIGSICSKCGYDLRASPFQCPECGDKI